ncbi:MAG: hypothetical protein GXY65_15570 [Rhodococcus sp.]|uniref:hypothetical protein n=1 Tax=Rhodococcus TaxID=1827 RepID=UPI0016A6CC82|nr:MULTISPECIES: hypothetical protein [Rhodococcus]NLV80723.1 hypothetical protein [Rhodococcus sp. (in: high G+C Gram-positive bacteria)]
MYANIEVHFGWTSRRVSLAGCESRTRGREDPEREVTLDRRVCAEGVTQRLLALHDPVADHDYVAVVVGRVTGSDDVPVRTVDEERLLLAAAHSRCPGEILVGTAGDDDPTVRELGHQLRRGGPLRTLLACSGARSVVIDWSDVPDRADAGRVTRRR